MLSCSTAYRNKTSRSRLTLPVCYHPFSGNLQAIYKWWVEFFLHPGGPFCQILSLMIRAFHSARGLNRRVATFRGSRLEQGVGANGCIIAVCLSHNTVAYALLLILTK